MEKDSSNQFIDFSGYDSSKINNQINFWINEDFGKTLENAVAYIAIIDLNGIVKYANRHLGGIPMDKYVGTCLYDWLPETLANIVKNNLIQIVDNPETLYSENNYLDREGVNHYFSSYMSPIMKNGEVVSISIISTDATDIKELEQKLNRNKDLVNLGLQAADMGVWDGRLDDDNLIWDDNLYKILGADASEVDASYQTLFKLIYDEDKERIVNETIFALSNKTKFEGEFRIRRFDNNEIRWISFKSKFTVDSDNKITRLLGIAWDNTDLKHLEFERLKTAELERQNIALQQFAYLASHDLKSPLRTINNFSGLLSQKFSNVLDETGLTYLGHIQSSVVRMDTQIKDLLKYAMLGHNGELTHIDCNKLLLDVIDDLNFAIKNSNCKVHIDELPIISGYRTEIALLFENLITNAIKFRQSTIDPIINISCREDENYFEFSVMDNGIGLDEIYKEKIFVLFQRLHFPEEYEGTGIGLAHCKKIVELHGGKIWVESKLNEGSTFYFTIKR